MSSETRDVAPHPSGGAVRAALRRLPRMVVVWGVIGSAVGVLTAQTPGPIGIIAGVIAGVIVLAPVGAVLALAGGRARDSLIGAGAGLALAYGLAGLGAAPSTPVSVVPFGILAGALIGATVVTAFYRLPLLVLSAGGGGRRAESNSP